MINPYETPQTASKLDHSQMREVDRDQCPVCAHRNTIGEMLRTKNYKCRACGAKLEILLGPRFERLILGGFVVLIALAVYLHFARIKLPFYPPFAFLPQFAWIAICLWIYRNYGYLGLPKTTWYSRLLGHKSTRHDGG